MTERLVEKTSKIDNWDDFVSIISMTSASYFLSSRKDNIENNLTNSVIFLVTIILTVSLGIIINILFGNSEINFKILIFVILFLILTMLLFIFLVALPLKKEIKNLIISRKDIQEDIMKFENLCPEKIIIEGKTY